MFISTKIKSGELQIESSYSLKQHNRIEKNFVEIAEVIALIVEDESSSATLCGELGQYIKKIVEKTDLTHPDTIRRLLPVALAIRDENAKIQRDVQQRKRSLFR